MELSENLFVIAQIAVRFAGFAGLVAAIASAWARRSEMRRRNEIAQQRYE
jgi:hypothetical protein